MRVIIFGAGRYGKVVWESLRAEGHDVLGWLDDNSALHGTLHCGVEVLGGLDYLRRCDPRDLGAIVAIGYSRVRLAVAAKLDAWGVRLINSVHPSAVVMPSVSMGRGNCICAGAIVQSCVRIGNNVIINTGATIDHDSVLEDGAWIAPGVHTGGCVTIGREAYVSIGAVIGAGVTIAEGAVIGAGAVVTRHVPAHTVALGTQPRLFSRDDSFDFKKLISGLASG